MLNIDEIVKKRDEAKDKKARAEGSLERVMQDLGSKHNIKTIEEVRVKLKEFQTDVENNKNRQDEILKEINEAVDWNAI